MSLSKQQLFRNSAWTLLDLSVFPLLMILATPVFINHLGIAHYGLWILVNTITLGMNLLNIGVGDSNIRLISQHRSAGHWDKIRQVFRYNFSLSLFLSGVVILITLVFYKTGFIALFYKGPEQILANKILLLAGFSAAMKFIEISLLSVFKAYERFDLYAMLNMLSRNTVIIAGLWLALNGYGLQDILSLAVMINLGNVLLQIIVLWRFLPKIISWPALLFYKFKPQGASYNLWYWLQSSIALSGFLADKLLVAVFFDEKTLGYYSVASTVAASIHNFFLAFGGFIFPRVSFKLASNHDIVPIYHAARALIALPGWLLIGALVFAGGPLFELWLGGQTFAQCFRFIQIYLVYEAGMLLIIVPFYFINAGSMVKLNSVFEAAIRFSHIASMIAGYYLAGIEGILWGLLLATLFNIPFQYYYFHRWIIKNVSNMQFVLVSLPVVFMALALLSNHWYILLPLLAAFALCCKLVYYDPAQVYLKARFHLKKTVGIEPEK